MNLSFRVENPCLIACCPFKFRNRGLYWSFLVAVYTSILLVVSLLNLIIYEGIYILKACMMITFATYLERYAYCVN